MIVNQPGACARCRTALTPGDKAHVGLRDDPSRGRAWLCIACIGRLEDDGAAR